MGGTLEPASAGLRVRVTVRNTGGQPAEDVRVHGELLGAHGLAEIPGTIAPGAAREATLDFPEVVPTAGVHALALRLDYDSVASAVSAVPLNQWAYLLIGFGGAPAPGLAVEVPRVRLDETAAVSVAVRSTDGRAHRVRLRLYVPRGLAVVPHRQTLDVPASGSARVPVRFFRSLAAPHSSHGVLALAVTEDEDVVGTSAAVSVAEIGADPALLPRVRGAVLAAAAALAVAGIAAQIRRSSSQKDLARPTPTV